MFDVLIRQGNVVDGSGRTPFRADLAIVGDRIASIGELEGEARVTIDASGLLVTPGFIDPHAHSDFALAFNPEGKSFVAQGVTTEIQGNCGFSAYPLDPSNRGLFLDPPEVKTFWTSRAEYRERVNRIGFNTASFVGHNTIRQLVVGRDRPAAPDEIERMKGLVSQAMEQGALGLSTGLDYSPSTNCTTDELLELLRVVADYGGMYATHVRRHSQPYLLQAIDEALGLALRAGIPCVLSHLMVHSRPNWGTAGQVLERIDSWRRRGVEVYADTQAYPNLGMWWAHRVIFPDCDWRAPWSDAVVGIQDRIRSDRDAVIRSIHENLNRDRSTFIGQFFSLHDWDTVVIEDLPASGGRYRGMSLASAARDMNKDPIDLYLDLLLSDGPRFSATLDMVIPSDHRALVTDPHYMFGSDAQAVAPEHARAPWSVSQVHPRHYGNAVYVLATLCRDLGWLDLPQAVRKLTSLPAECFRLSGRGRLRVGMFADVVVLDLYRLRSRATCLLPHQYPDGIDQVLVNGQPVVSDGQLCGTTPGRIIDRS